MCWMMTGCFAYQPGNLKMWPSGCSELSVLLLSDRWDQTYAVRKSLSRMKPFREALIQDHQSVLLIMSVSVTCQIRLIPVQHYCHAAVLVFSCSSVLTVCVLAFIFFFIFSHVDGVQMSLHRNLPDECDMMHFWSGVTRYFAMLSNISTFLLLNNHLLKALMIFWQFLTFTVNRNMISWVMYWLWIKCHIFLYNHMLQ